jgi:hypothetical protein
MLRLVKQWLVLLVHTGMLHNVFVFQDHFRTLHIYNFRS